MLIKRARLEGQLPEQVRVEGRDVVCRLYVNTVEIVRYSFLSKIKERAFLLLGSGE